MRVLLINPPPQQRVDQYDTPDFTRLGLAYLAGQLLTHSTATVAIVDAKFERLRFDQVEARIRAFKPDVVGLTAFTNEIKPAARVARLAKSISASIVTVVGGSHVTALPAETLVEFPEFDIGAVGEGEITFHELVGALAAGSSIDHIDGLVHRVDGRPVRNAPRENVRDQDTIPFPAWDLLPAGRRFLFMSQRGCPYQCSFCQNPNGRVVRKRSVGNVVEELRYLVDRFGPDEITMCDEIFTVDMERTHRLLDAIIAADLPRKLKFWAQTHVNVVDRELFRKMKAAGCHRCGLGIETGDREVMKAMHKGITREKVIAARRMAADAGLAVEGLFIIGHPHETWESAMRTIDFGVELNPDIPVFSTMVPYPGTEIAELAKRGEGGYRLISTDWNDYMNQIGHSLEFEHLSRRQIELLQMIGYFKVFLANGRLKDFAKFAWEYKSEGAAVVRKLLSGRMPGPIEPIEAPLPPAPRTSPTPSTPTKPAVRRLDILRP